jgi:hypothetical protein
MPRQATHRATGRSQSKRPLPRKGTARAVADQAHEVTRKLEALWVYVAGEPGGSVSARQPSFDSNRVANRAGVASLAAGAIRRRWQSRSKRRPSVAHGCGSPGRSNRDCVVACTLLAHGRSITVASPQSLRLLVGGLRETWTMWMSPVVLQST